MATSIIDTICAVQHVSECRVIEEQGEITQIFVEANLAAMDQSDPTQQIKSMVRSIVGALAIHHNLDLDYRKIKVIEYKKEPPEPNMQPRIRIVAAYQRRFPKSEMVVELHCLGNTYIGVAPFKGDLLDNTFVACIDALQQMGCGDSKPVYIRELKNEFSHERAVLVKLTYQHPSGSEDHLMGIAEIKEEIPLAVVQAVLGAVNRRFVVAYPD